MALNEKQKRQWKRFRETMGMTKENRGQCALLCRKYWPKDCRRTMKTADELLRHTFLFQLPWDMEQTREPVDFPGEINWKFCLHEDPEFTFQMNRHRFWICLGQAYSLTGDQRYADEFVYQLLDWLEKEPWEEKNAKLTWRTLEAGLRADYWARAMALCADSPGVTEEAAGQFLEGLEAHGKCLFYNPERGFSQKSNWGIMEYAGLYLLGHILEREDYIQKARCYLKNGLHIQVMDDGMHWEMSHMYHNEVLMAYLETIRVGRLWGDEPFSREELEIIRRMAELTLMVKTPSGHQPMTGDSDDTDVRNLLSQAALLLKDGRLKAGAYKKLDFEGIWMFGCRGAEDYRNIPVKEPEAGLKVFPSSGQAAARSGWGEDKGYLYFVNGPLGGGHGHQDKLHIGLWMDGEEVLADSGRCTYRDIPLRYQLKSAMAHNVPMLPGQEYAPSKDTWTYEALLPCFPGRALQKNGYLFLEGSHSGYLARGILVRRRIVAVDSGLVAVSDTFLGNLPEEILQNFHFGEEIELSLEGEKVKGRGRRCRFLLWSFAEGRPVVPEQGSSPISRHYNHLGERERLTVRGRDTRTLTTFFIRRQEDEEVAVTYEPVCCALSGESLTPREGEGYVIRAGGRKTGLVLLHHEAGNRKDYRGIQGVYGLGQVMVCRLGEPQEGMTVLQW